MNFSTIFAMTVIASAITGLCYGLAVIIREWFRGMALLIRARRGDPEPPIIVVAPSAPRHALPNEGLAGLE